MFNLFQSSQRPFGLDVSDFSAKIISLKQKGRYFDLQSWGKAEIPPELIIGGQIKKEKEVAEILRELIKKAKGEKIKTGNVVVSLPEEESFFRIIQLPPKISGKNIEEALAYEIEANIPSKIEDIYYDWQLINPLRGDEKHTNILVAALPKSIIDSYFSLVRGIGLEPVAFEIESQALARDLISGSKSLHPIVLLDIGAAGTGFTIFSNETLLFTGHINISGKDFTNLIARNFDIDWTKAEELKKKIGLKKKKEADKIFDSLVPIFTDLSEQIKRFIDFYKDHIKIESVSDDSIEKVLLSGGDSLISGFSEFLKESLGLPVELGNPWVNIRDPKNPKLSLIPNEEPLMFATAMGLALRSAMENF